MSTFPKPKCARCRKVARAGHACPTPRAIARSSLPTRGDRPPRKNRQRQAREWPRAYGSKARVKFVSRLPCAACGYAGRVPRDCAHTVTDGMGRKGHYTTIIPLCNVQALNDGGALNCHGRQHSMGWSAIGMSEEGRRRAAERTEALWQLSRGGDGHDA